MRIPRMPTRPLIAAAVLAAAVILTTGIGQTHATEPVNLARKRRQKPPKPSCP